MVTVPGCDCAGLIYEYSVVCRRYYYSTYIRLTCCECVYDYECSQHRASFHVHVYFTWHVSWVKVYWLTDNWVVAFSHWVTLRVRCNDFQLTVQCSVCTTVIHRSHSVTDHAPLRPGLGCTESVTAHWHQQGRQGYVINIMRCIVYVGTRAQELCESRGGRSGLASLISLRFLWT